MKQVTFTSAAAAHAAGVARLRPGQGTDAAFCAYPWPIGDTRATHVDARMNVVITESKLHLRWPGDPPS